jgi:hypothetical protein
MPICEPCRREAAVVHVLIADPQGKTVLLTRPLCAECLAASKFSLTPTPDPAPRAGRANASALRPE